MDPQCIQPLKDITKKINAHSINLKCKVSRSLATWINLKNGHLSFEEGTSFLLEHPEWPVWNKLIVNLEEKIDSKTNKATLLKWFLKHPPLSLKGMNGLLSKLSLTEQKQPEIRKLLNDFWVNFNFSAAEQQSFYRKHAPLLTATCHQRRLEKLLWEEHTTLANFLIPLITKRNQPTYRQWINAIKGKPIPAAYRTHPGIATAISKILRKAENYIEAYKVLLEAAPQRAFLLPKKFLREYAVVSRELVILQQVTLALQLAEKGLQITPVSHEYYVEFHWLAGWIATAHLKNSAKGMAYFKKAFDLTPSSFEKAQYAFWAGYAAEIGSHSAEKNQWYSIASQYPQTYYGQVANDILNQPLCLPELKINNSEQLKIFMNRPLVTAALIMNALGHHKIKSIFLDHLAHTLKTVEEHKIGLAVTKATSIPYFTFHYYEEANKLVNLAVKDNWLKVEFDSTKLHNPHLIQAIVYNESRFHPKIKDSLGAIGFMQIMPTTLSHITTTNGLPKQNHKDLGNQPLRSLQLGETYLAELSEKFKHLPILITAAYNGGPSRLSKWLEKFPEPKSNYDFLWLEAFPVYDTRKYVKRVITAMRLYDELGSDVPVRTVGEFLKDFDDY